jgi:hypothetical protein
VGTDAETLIELGVLVIVGGIVFAPVGGGIIRIPAP